MTPIIVYMLRATSFKRDTFEHKLSMFDINFNNYLGNSKGTSHAVHA